VAVCFLNPRLFRLHAVHQIELGIALDFLCEDNNMDTTAIEGTCSKRPSTTDTTGTKVDSMRYALGTEKVRVKGGGDDGCESVGELASGEGLPKIAESMEYSRLAASEPKRKGDASNDGLNKVSVGGMALMPVNRLVRSWMGQSLQNWACLEGPLGCAVEQVGTRCS
jgi:hypothetical protein